MADLLNRERFCFFRWGELCASCQYARLARKKNKVGIVFFLLNKLGHCFVVTYSQIKVRVVFLLLQNKLALFSSSPKSWRLCFSHSQEKVGVVFLLEKKLVFFFLTGKKRKKSWHCFLAPKTDLAFILIVYQVYYSRHVIRTTYNAYYHTACNVF